MGKLANRLMKIFYKRVDELGDILIEVNKEIDDLAAEREKLTSELERVNENLQRVKEGEYVTHDHIRKNEWRKRELTYFISQKDKLLNNKREAREPYILMARELLGLEKDMGPIFRKANYEKLKKQEEAESCES